MSVGVGHTAVIRSFDLLPGYPDPEHSVECLGKSLDIPSCPHRAVRKILARARQLVDAKKEDGFTALHLAALNNHREVAQVLIREVGAGVPGPPKARNQTKWDVKAEPVPIRALGSL